MRHSYVLLALAVLFAPGCATVDKLKEGIPEVTKLGPNEYEIYYLGGVFHDRKTLWQKWDAEAAKVCNGKYQIIERKYENNIEGSDNIHGRIRCSQTSPSANTANTGASSVSATKKDTTPAPTPPAPGRADPPQPKMTVQQVQQRLSELGYQPGPADGKMGKSTAEALKKFQQDNGLAKTGQADNETIAKLLQKKEVKVETSSPPSQPAAEAPQKAPPIRVRSATDL